MPECYFAVGTSLALLKNFETIVTDAPNVQPDRQIPFTGQGRRQTLDRLVHHVGDINGSLAWWALTQVDLDALHTELFGNYPILDSSKFLYFTLIDETGRYSPFSAVVEKPRIGRDYRLADTGAAYEGYALPLYDIELQMVTKSGTATLTASERLVMGNTTGGGFTLTLPLANAVNANTVLSIVKSAAANTLTIARQGTNTINGGTSSITLTAINSRYDLVSDGSGAWVTL